MENIDQTCEPGIRRGEGSTRAKRGGGRGGEQVMGRREELETYKGGGVRKRAGVRDSTR